MPTNRLPVACTMRGFDRFRGDEHAWFAVKGTSAVVALVAAGSLWSAVTDERRAIYAWRVG